MSNDFAKALTAFGGGFLSASKSKKDERKSDERWEREFGLAMQRMDMENKRFERERINMLRELHDTKQAQTRSAYDAFWKGVYEGTPPAIQKEIVDDTYGIQIDVPDEVALKAKEERDIAEMMADQDKAYNSALGQLQAYNDMGIPLPGTRGGAGSNKPSVAGREERAAVYEVLRENAQAYLEGVYQTSPEQDQAIAEHIRANYENMGGERAYTPADINKLAPFLPPPRVDQLRRGAPMDDKEMMLAKEVLGGTNMGQMLSFVAENGSSADIDSLLSGTISQDRLQQLSRLFNQKSNENQAGIVDGEIKSLEARASRDELGNPILETLPNGVQIPQFVIPEDKNRYLDLMNRRQAISTRLVPQSQEAIAASGQQKKQSARDEQKKLLSESVFKPTSPLGAAAASLAMPAIQSYTNSPVPLLQKKILDNVVTPVVKGVGDFYESGVSPEGYTGWVKDAIGRIDQNIKNYETNMPPIGQELRPDQLNPFEQYLRDITPFMPRKN